ncbi:MAG: Pr6Pr family membrane protein [Bacteroidetes bacterium]|nr:Pr6Pr family membrane protein [Bacteroidota bacterium]
MKIKFAFIITLFAWFALIAQFFLMLQNRQADLFETIIRFFCFFTILTNLLVALCFTAIAFNLHLFFFKVLSKHSSLTALTAFILIVGLVYQFALRNLWNPTGLQFIVDELLHSMIPLLVLIYWIINVAKTKVEIKPVMCWLIYPILYIVIILVRGAISGFYPYPFLNITQIGYEKAFINIGLIFGIAFILLAILIGINKVFTSKMPG